jgi:sigma-E factor negative regulatory protein RseB
MRPDSRAAWIWAVLATGAGFAGRAFADDAHEWLERMNTALMTRSYVGDFFHVQDGRVEALRIIHRVERGEVRERLVSLDGSGREFIRTGTELACYLPDKKTVLVEERPAGDSLFANLPAFDHGAAGSYELQSHERARLMGRDTRVITVTPHDEFRYGYRLWIDESTAMPLKTQLCDEHGNVIEQVVFAHITLPERIPDSDFLPGISTHGFRWLRHEPKPVTSGVPNPAVGPDNAGNWSALRLPPGFRMTTRTSQPMPGSAGPVTHLVFSDGLASVSVFVESGAAPEGTSGEALSRVGSSSAYSTVVEGHQVTAVGEVPPETVRYIASSVQQQMPAGVPGAPTIAPTTIATVAPAAMAPPLPERTIAAPTMPESTTGALAGALPDPARAGFAGDPGTLGLPPGQFGPGPLSLNPGR